MRYYISDCHFFHEALNWRMDKRGFESVEAMNQYMIEKWNGKVRPKDEVVVIGDLSWGTAEQTNMLLKQLNGKLYLICGNHDRFLGDKEFDRSRLVWVKPYMEMRDAKRKVVLSHYPMMCYNGQYRMDEEGNSPTYMLYGHVHDTYDQRLIEQFQEIMRNTVRQNFNEEEIHIPCNMINCFCMYSDYEPLTLDEWIVCDRKRRLIV
jgi:calcineurin-like phosphoesterase family protein